MIYKWKYKPGLQAFVSMYHQQEVLDILACFSELQTFFYFSFCCFVNGILRKQSWRETQVILLHVCTSVCL